MDFAIFALTLLGIAVFHRCALLVATAGLVAAVLLHVFGTAVPVGTAISGVVNHFAGEWVILTNLLLLLLGFAVLANQFEQSGLPETLPSRLPHGWTGGLVLLGLVFGLSTFLDNIAGAVIGGVAARNVYRNGVTIGYMAAIVSAANAGGAGSVIGDTTTTMMWISGISALDVLPAFIGATAAFAVVAPLAAIAQERKSPAVRREVSHERLDWGRVYVVGFVLAALVVANVVANSAFPEHEEFAPVLGLVLWAATLLSALFRRPDWSIMRSAFKGSLFLVVLVALASLMPIERLPEPSPATVFGLGILSAVFDNIPLTALALNQGGYDWALLAYAVGFGGSMVWFGSSAGVALTDLFPHGRSVFAWLRESWFVLIAYAFGFIAMLLTR
jgi:Na+/H+ antiporter NhaD/arsenite permease-like protein